MVLQLFFKAANYVFESKYFYHGVIAIIALVITYAFSQGRTTNRERDLHARTIVITGGFSPLGITLISSLAFRGAHIVAVSPYPLSHPQPSLIIPALREATKNDKIFAEYADLSSPKSIREFCTRFLTGDDQRVDGIVFAHEYEGIGSLFGSSFCQETKRQETKRETRSLASFLIITLLLPALLVAPVERDIRIVNVVNPFYAAAIPSFTSSLIGGLSADSETSAVPRSVFVSEGDRALRTTIFVRHLQRILNALPNRAPALDRSGPSGKNTPAASEPTLDEKDSKFPSNIVAVSVCPGIGRSETIGSLLGGEYGRDPEGYSVFGHMLSYLLFPIIWLFFKNSRMAMQSVLHALFLPTPLKRALAHAYASVDATMAASQKEAANNAQKDEGATGGMTGDLFTEVVKPGALYRECSVVSISVPPLPTVADGDTKANQQRTAKDDLKKKGPSTGLGEELVIEEDGEYGGESMGRVVWEWYEKKLKAWEAVEKELQPRSEDAPKNDS
ncbi:hypothetical protein EIP86_008318 [Pleurotus ostreatoroseus]|nr:hypothetical protein EIP86_008318 [Pleurotus ostreatoroseus]